MVLESRSGECEVGEQAMDEGNAGNVQRKIEPPAEIVVYCID